MTFLHRHTIKIAKSINAEKIKGEIFDQCTAVLFNSKRKTETKSISHLQ